MPPTRQQGAEPTSLPVYKADQPIPASLRGAVVAIGNFDGLHLGHQRLISVAQDAARLAGTIAAVLTFDPHPRAFFRPEVPMFRLLSWPVKVLLLERLGLDAVFVRSFDRALAETAADAFVADLLVEQLGASGVVVGEDFHFGRRREGTPAVLLELADRHGIGCTLVAPVRLDGAAVSSSAVRAALEQGEVAAANRLLGYRWLVAGEVVHGHKRGRDLGFPTANLQLDPSCRLAHGIYAVRVRLESGALHDGVASFGSRPTFDDGAPLLETFLFDFSGDLYGQDIRVELLGWIRGEAKFETADALVERMHADAKAARAIAAEAEGRSLIA